MKKLLGFFLVGLFSAMVAIFAMNKMNGNDNNETKVIFQENQPASLTTLPAAQPVLAADGFVSAANVATPAVVHIKTTSSTQTTSRGNSIWDFFGDQYESVPQMSSGSGVILSSDGFIVTNNHVIEDADHIQVIMDDKKEYEAELIGRDPSTDLAVLKINAPKSLSYLTFANSDQVQVGEWVLAVGNPFNLASTVTAGIVSAKARNINILREKAGNLAIESFIQTDAAVNPGNSGGALVDLKGNLIGVNTAIATPTGTYAGYSFAVPANLVEKVVEDITEFGVVQRGFLGVSIISVTADQAKEMGMDKVEGVYISEIVRGSGAEDAGIQAGDIITKINGTVVKTSPELQELVARYRPGDQLDVKLFRKGNSYNKTVTLKGKDNTTALLTKKETTKSTSTLNKLGGVFEEISESEAQSIGVKGGVKVKKLKGGILSEYTELREGFVITKVNNIDINNVDEFEKMIERNSGEGILLEGRYPGQKGTRFYAFGM